MKRPGTFEVRITSACAKGMGGSKFAVEIGGSRFQAVTSETGQGWRDYETRSLGEAALGAGRHELAIRPSLDVQWKSMSVKSVELIRLEGSHRKRG